MCTWRSRSSLQNDMEVIKVLAVPRGLSKKGNLEDSTIRSQRGGRPSMNFLINMEVYVLLNLNSHSTWCHLTPDFVYTKSCYRLLPLYCLHDDCSLTKTDPTNSLSHRLNIRSLQMPVYRNRAPFLSSLRFGTSGTFTRSLGVAEFSLD